MLGEFLLRLAVALPLVCALAALSLLAVKRGWLRLPSLAFVRQPRAVGPAALDVLAVHSLTPAARLAVIRFAGREHLVGVAGQSLLLIASSPDQPATSQEPPTWTS